MGLFSLILAFSSLAASVWLNQLLVAVAVGVFLLLYLLLLLHDMAGLNSTLAAILIGQQSSGSFLAQLPGFRGRPSGVGQGAVRTAGKFRAQTYYGRDVAAKLSALRYRLLSQQWQSLLPRVEDLEILQETDQAPSEPLQRQLQDAPPLFVRIVQLLRENFGAVAQAVVVSPMVTSTECRCYSAGRHGANFKTVLTRRLEGYFSQGDKSCLGRHDHEVERKPYGVFLQYGLRFSLCFPFQFSDRGINYQALIWLGYLDRQAPLDFESVRAKALTDRLSKELQTSVKLQSLASRAKEAEAESRQKSEYLAHISHDIRSPLNNIKAILGLLQCEVERQPSVRELVEIALSNCTCLSEIIEDVLDYTRHQAGQLVARPEPFLAAATISEVINSYSIAASTKGLDIRFTFDQSSRDFVYADKRQIKRVITNLVSNAIKYTNHGEVEISLLPGSAGYCVVTVRDTGIGIDAAARRSLFQPFQRGNHGNIEGVGLGLALVKILLELNGASVVLSSEPGYGSEFTLMLPAAEREVVRQASSDVAFEKQLAHVAHCGNSAKIDLKAPNLLVIDDDPDCVETLARNLELKGYGVSKAFSLRDAFRMIKVNRPDLVLSDAKMPGGGAEKLLQRIRKNHQHLPVVLISGLGSPADCNKYLALGAEAVHEKPVDIEALHQQITNSLVATVGSAAQQTHRRGAPS